MDKELIMQQLEEEAELYAEMAEQIIWEEIWEN